MKRDGTESEGRFQGDAAQTPLRVTFSCLSTH